MRRKYELGGYKFQQSEAQQQQQQEQPAQQQWDSEMQEDTSHKWKKPTRSRAPNPQYKQD